MTKADLACESVQQGVTVSDKDTPFLMAFTIVDRVSKEPISNLTWLVSAFEDLKLKKSYFI